MRVLAIGSLVLTLVAATPASAQLTRAMRDYSGVRTPIRGDIRLPAPVNPTLERSSSVSRCTSATRPSWRIRRCPGAASDSPTQR